MRAWLVISLLLSLSPHGAAIAQDDTARVEAARKAAERRVEADMITMTSLVEAMAKNLGQLHFLRTLCFGANDQQWRQHMAQMLNVEAPGDAVRQRDLTRAFNAGYYQEQAQHMRCDGTVSADVAALSENGRSIAAMLGDPFRPVPGSDGSSGRIPG